MMEPAREDAIKRGDVQTVLDLLGRATDIDARDRYGQTALMLAAHAGHHKFVETLSLIGQNRTSLPSLV